MTARPWLTVFGLSILAASAAVGASAFDGISPGDPFPEVKLATADGAKIAIPGDFKGRPFVIAFWRIGQRQSERLLQDLAELSTESKVDALIVCSGESDPARVKKAAGDLAPDLTMVMDPERQLYGRLRVIVAPATGFVDSEGVFRFSYASHRSDFAQFAKDHVAFLQGKISDSELSQRVERRDAGNSARNDSEDTQLQLAVRCALQGRTARAEEELTQLWNSGAGPERAGVVLGELHLSDQRYDEARAVFTKLRERAPQSPEVLAGLAKTLLATNETKQGQELGEQALALGAKDLRLYQALGKAAERAKDKDAARDYFRKGLELAIEDAPLFP